MAFDADKAEKLEKEKRPVVSGSEGVLPDSLQGLETPTRPMIEVRGLVKTYKQVDALKKISFVVNEGDAFGFIGPNGAGKTTTIRILTTLLQPTEGEVFIDGIPVVDDPDGVRELIGYMPDYFGVYDGMKVWEYLDFFAATYNKNSNDRKGLISDVLEITDLTIKKDTYIETLSKGMKQRLCVAKTLLNDPKVLILDEPASGLDPRARVELKELLKELTRMKKTIFISSHILPELSDLCNTIGIIEAGKMIAVGSVEEFTHDLKSANTLRSIKISVLGDKGEARKIISSSERVLQLEEENSSFKLEFNGVLEDVADFLAYLVEKKIRVVDFSEKGADLEDVFMKLTKGEVS